MNDAHLSEIAGLARRLPRVGSAFPRTDPNGLGKLNAYIDALIKDERRRAGEAVAAHWREIADEREKAGRLAALAAQLKAEHDRSLWGWIKAWWKA